MIALIVPGLLAVIAIGIEAFQRGELEDRGTELLLLTVGLALTYGHRFIRPIGIELASVSKYIGWAIVLVASIWLAFPEILPTVSVTPAD